MSPDQIEAVRRGWASALADGDALVASIAARLDGVEAAARARWATDAISRLLLVLDRPTAFGHAVASALADVRPIGPAEVDGVQHAVVAALRDRPAGVDGTDEQAWRLAFALFRELVTASRIDLDPPTS